MKQISVLFIVGGLPYGGIENLLLDLITHLDRDRFEFRVINLSGKGIFNKKFLERGIEIINMGFHLSTHRLDNTWRLRRHLRRLSPDIIFTSQFSANYHGRLASIGLVSKVITQVHNIKREPYWERRLADRLLGRIRTDCFIAVSQKVQEVLATAVPSSIGKTSVLYNAVSLDRLGLPSGYSREAFRKQEGIGEHDFVVIAAGRLVYQKGFDILISAISKVISEVPEVRLLIAGDGGMWRELEGLIESLSLQGKVRLLGYREDIPSLLAASDLFIMPSRWEGFGVAALEAITLGVPAVLTDTSPIREVVPEGANVQVVPCEVEAIAEAVVANAQSGGAGLPPTPKLMPPSAGMDMRQYARRVEEIFLRLFPSHEESKVAGPGSPLG